MEDNVIVCNCLTHYYGRRCIYSDLSFNVAKGTITGLLGKNGTGKTTTINILMGYLKPTAGRCTVFGEDASCISPLTRAKIALLLEGHVQYSFMTIGQIERFYSRFYPKWNRDAAKAASASAWVNTSAKCSNAPQPPEAMTGMWTALVTARVISRSKPFLVPSASMEVSKISPAPRASPFFAHSMASNPVGVRPPATTTS